MTPDTDPPAEIQLTPLPGSERPSAPEASTTEPALASDERVEMTLVLRRRAELPDVAMTPRMTTAELEAGYGADPADVAAVVDTLTGAGLEIIATDPGSRRIRVAGPIALVSRVFGANLERVASADPGGGRRTHRQRTGELSVPSSLAGIVTAVLGLDDRPQARSMLRIAEPSAVSRSYTPPELATIYQFPDGDGSGQTIAILELGGGYDDDDLQAYFSGLGLPMPSVTSVGVDGASNGGGNDPQGADAEVLLDIEVAGAVAPGAAIVVYFAPNTDAGFLDALSQSAHADPTPVAISISWGASENSWTPQARTAMDAALADAAALGVTVTAAAGDDGSSDRVEDRRAHVDFPASSPHCLGCGGTTLDADPATGTVSSETVWNNGPSQGATGGGVSNVFDAPAWQSAVGVPGSGGRGVPDVAAVADPNTGYQVRVDGVDTVIGGTSAVSPLWAGLVARLAQLTGSPFGLLQPLLYGDVTAGEVAPGFRDVTDGDNGIYSAGPGWDATTGLGVPVGADLLTLVTAAARG